MRDALSLTREERDKQVDLFVTCCKHGVELKLEPWELAATLQAFCNYLLHETRPLSFFVQNPHGSEPNTPHQN